MTTQREVLLDAAAKAAMVSGVEVHVPEPRWIQFGDNRWPAQGAPHLKVKGSAEVSVGRVRLEFSNPHEGAPVATVAWSSIGSAEPLLAMQVGNAIQRFSAFAAEFNRVVQGVPGYGDLPVVKVLKGGETVKEVDT